MDNTIKQILIFEDGVFYSYTPAGRHMLSEDELAGLKPGYVLVLSDSCLFYTTMEFPDAPKRKLNLFISNYLLGSFPAALCEKFCYISKGDKILIGIFSGGFAESFDKYGKIFSRASYVTSPLTAAYMENENFEYSVNGAAFKITDGLITNEEAVSEPMEPSYAPDPAAKLNIPFVKHTSASYSEYRIPAAVLIACFLIFVMGDYFRLRASTNKVKKAEAALETVYSKAGVSKSRDPYGALLAKAGRDSDGAKFKTLFLLETISQAYNENITTESIELKGSNVTFQGSSADYTFLEQFKKAVSEQTGKEVQLLDTVKKDNQINFTMRFDI